MTIINFDKIIGEEYKTITNNKYCLNHPSNTSIVAKTNSGKTNILFNLIAKNSIYDKIFTVLIEIIVFPSLHLNKNASLLMTRNDVFTGTVSESTPLSTQRRFAFVIISKFKTLSSFKL